jgi:hypothetical protein
MTTREGLGTILEAQLEKARSRKQRYYSMGRAVLIAMELRRATGLPPRPPKSAE